MNAFAARLHITQALARYLRGEVDLGHAEVQAARRAGGDGAMLDRLSAAATAEPEALALLAREIGIDVSPFCCARVLAAYQDLDWRQIPRWEAAVVATGDAPSISWMALVDYNAGRWERSIEKLELLCSIDPAGSYGDRLADCRAKLAQGRG